MLFIICSIHLNLFSYSINSLSFSSLSINSYVIILHAADKNPSPNATDEFRRVSDAFELLGDPNERRRYDAKLRQEQQRRRNVQEQQRRQEEQRRSENARKQKERQRRQREMAQRSRAMQGRVVKIGDVGEFGDVVLDSKREVYKTHCLIMFVSNKNAERKGEEEFYFPYPFAGEMYDNMLQVAKVSCCALFISIGSCIVYYICIFCTDLFSFTVL